MADLRPHSASLQEMSELKSPTITFSPFKWYDYVNALFLQGFSPNTTTVKLKILFCTFSLNK